MIDPHVVGRILIVAGVALAIVGVSLVTGVSIPLVRRLGQLPGDLVFRRGPVTVAIPIVTSIILSVVLTIALALFRR
ncbi:MAG: DUF2905 domain-containing protein [Chloroflexota bacterium]|nr:DUF2905 domain-containing protein [Chloroflexia bacterium]MDQ3168312.1 DUF2905 domain-containing protein [Chloroflexota bacterium]